jgi:hypothetical protein
MPISFDLANKYRKKGWSIFPVILTEDPSGKVQKKPAVPWREYIDRLPTEYELKEWFGPERYNGIGLATGAVSGVVVIDVEAEAEPETVEFFNRTPFASRTISGGWHFYYKATEALRNTVRLDDKLVDFRGDGGFVVLPPSGINKKKYSWQKTEGGLGSLPPLPDDVIKMLQAQNKSGGEAKPVFNFDQDEYPYPDVYEGGRNAAAAQVIGSILARIPRNQWKIMGWATIKDWNENHCHPSLPEFELKQTWESIVAGEMRNHPEGREIDQVEKEETYRIYQGEEALNEYKKMKEKWGDGITTGDRELDSYFKFLPQHLYLISAQTHQGKTTFALNIAAKQAALGYRVFFASLEQGVFIAPRIVSMVGGKFPESLSILDSDENISVKTIIKVIEQMPIKPDIVTIDHLHFIKKKDTKSPTESIDDMMSQLQSMSKKINLPVVIISHLRKLNADRPPELDDLRDSSSLSQIPSVIMLLHRKKSQNMEFGDTFLEKEGRLYIAKNRLADRTGSVFFRLEDSGNFTIGNSYEKPRAEDKINYYKKDAPQKIKIPTIYD